MGRSRPFGTQVQTESTRVAPSIDVKSTVTSNGTGADVLRHAMRRFSSNAVQTAWFSAVPFPSVLTTARLVEPTCTGRGEVSSSSIALGDHLRRVLRIAQHREHVLHRAPDGSTDSDGSHRRT